MAGQKIMHSEGIGVADRKIGSRSPSSATGQDVFEADV